jgi:hypothetical protein
MAFNMLLWTVENDKLAELTKERLDNEDQSSMNLRNASFNISLLAIRSISMLSSSHVFTKEKRSSSVERGLSIRMRSSNDPTFGVRQHGRATGSSTWAMETTEIGTTA